MILVDTSVWVQHLREGNRSLRRMLLNSQVASHPFVLGEIACGNLKNRGEILKLLASLPQVEVAETDDVLTLLENYRLFGRGVGWVDAHILASAKLSDVPLWTADKRLAAAAKPLKVVTSF